jgi:adenosine kinase
MDFPDTFSNHLLPDKLHILNVCFLVNGLEEKFGGTAGNIAYSLALLGEKATVLAAVGNDFDRYEQWLVDKGISMEGIKLVSDTPTASAYITTDQADNQITAFNPGAMGYATAGDFTAFSTNESLAIVSPGNLEDMQEYPRKYREMGIPFIFDPGQNIPAFSGEQLKEMITGSKVLIANDYELTLISKATGLSKDDLLDLTETVVTTLGERGSRISRDGKDIEVPAVPVDKPVDPTGAGDAFRSGFIKGLRLGRSIEEAAQMGATCASFCVEHHGTQAHTFSQDDFWQRHQRHFT